MSDPDPSVENGLPCEPGSSSDLLASTHVFQVEVCSLNELPWGPGPVGQKRFLELTLRLGGVFKGILSVAQGETFILKVDQHRVDPFAVEDVPGAWSHVQPSPGEGYLVLARGTSTQPAELMQTGVLNGLFEPSRITDVRLALQAERRTTPRASATNVFRSQVRFAQEHSQDVHDLYARYFWARVSPAIAMRPSARLPGILALVTAEEAGILFRQELLSLLDSAATFFELTPKARMNVAKGYVAILLQAASEPLHRSLAYSDLPGLLFQEGRPILKVRDVVPDRRDRERLREAAVIAIDEPEYRELADWIDGKGSKA